MDATTRQAEILNLLQVEGACSINELADRFSVSDETVRRDVKQLETMGHVLKVHGGVRLPENIFETPFRQRQFEQTDAKQRIGAAVSNLVTDGMTVSIESSTTAFWVARHLKNQRNLSVITNGLEIVRELCGRNNNRIFLSGGEVSDSTLSTLGPSAMEFVERFTPELLILGASGLHAEAGLCDFHMAEAEFAKAILTRAQRVAVIADSTKFNRRALIHICNFDRIDHLVTDREPEGELRAALRDVDVIVA